MALPQYTQIRWNRDRLSPPFPACAAAAAAAPLPPPLFSATAASIAIAAAVLEVGACSCRSMSGLRRGGTEGVEGRAVVLGRWARGRSGREGE